MAAGLVAAYGCLMAHSVVVSRRFRGPVDSGQGGYSAGVAASFVDGPAHVRLRRPTPLDRSLDVRWTDEGVSLLDGEEVILQASAVQRDATPEIDGLELSTIFERGPQPSPGWHMAPTCFACGTQASLGMHPTRMADSEVWATVWTPPPVIGENELAAEVTWALLDCPGGWATMESKRPARSFFPALADMTADIRQAIPLGSPVAVLGWMTSDGERRIESESAVVDESGTVLAHAALSQAVVPANWADS